MHGRPGLNPLRPTKRIAATLPASVAARLPGRFGRQLAQGRTARFFGLRVLAADQARLDLFRHTVLPADLEANLEAIGSAAAQADVTIASIHAHIQRPWLRRFAHRAIERGADVVFVQGPHEVRAIEFHAGKPIFYSLGDFVYQPHRITRFPSEMYEAFGLGPEATVRDLWPIWERGTGLGSKRKTFEAVAAVLQFDGRRIERIRLLPLDLQFDADAEIRGRPRLADPRLGRKIIEEIAALSRRRGTIVRYDAALNEGIVEPA